jgi:hypothetical protein
MKAGAIHIMWGFNGEIGRREVGERDGLDDFVRIAQWMLEVSIRAQRPKNGGAGLLYEQLPSTRIE